MKMRTFILAGIAIFAIGGSSFALGGGSAVAGPCATEIEGLTKALAAKDAGSGPTSGASSGTQPAAKPSGQHPPTAIMGQESQGKATSAEDVRRQTGGQPTTADQGTTGVATEPGTMNDAGLALDRARTFDRQGKEAECMEAVREAKNLAGHH
jgi:hypothetical protein